MIAFIISELFTL